MRVCSKSLLEFTVLTEISPTGPPGRYPGYPFTNSLCFGNSFFVGSLYYQPKQCSVSGKSLKITIHLHSLIPPKWVAFNLCFGVSGKYLPTWAKSWILRTRQTPPVTYLTKIPKVRAERFLFRASAALFCISSVSGRPGI